MARLPRSFYLGDTVEIARSLVGKYLLRMYEGEILLGRITETEAYVGRMDKACHTYNYRRTARTEVMFGEAGHAYIYFTYGMHHCLNFVTEEIGEPSAVLIRGMEPVLGAETMAQLRFQKPLAELTSYQKKNFLNGPGKLCKALALTRAENGIDLLGDVLACYDSAKDFGLPDAPLGEIKVGKRIGIDYAEEAVDFPWRFYI